MEKKERNLRPQICSEDKVQTTQTMREARTSDSRTFEIFTESAERTLNFLTQTARSKYSVITEGPPIYLWPPVDVLSWNNKAFISGWEVANKLQKRLPENKRSNYILVDDLNYMPGGVVSTHERMRELYRSSKAIQESPLFAKPTVQNKLVLESSLASDLKSKTCSVLDAAFNKMKIIDQLTGPYRSPALHPVNIDKLLLIVINPDTPEIRAEQLNMFQALYEQLRADPVYAKISKELTRKAITDTYQHVWIEKSGKASSITKPVYANNRFSYKEVYL